MTILYTVHPGGQYVNLENISDEEMQSGIKVYVNATNRCPCSCTFCLRTKKHMAESNTLWLKREPTLEEILAAFKKYDLNNFKEVIFCGFGEPLVRVDDLMQVADYIKGIRPDLPIRVNTVGLANQVHNRDIIPELKGRIDTVSISLNTPSKEEYYKLTRSKFVDHVISDEEIAQCQKICDRLGVTLRVRPYEEN